MLIHINQPETAALIENAWLKTLEDGIHTADIYSEKFSKQKVNTDEFADAVIVRLGQKPSHFKPASYQQNVKAKIECYGDKKTILAKKELIGIDIFLDNPDLSPEQLGKKIKNLSEKMELVIITSRGLKIWPNCMIDSPYAHHCSCRFQSSSDVKKLKSISHEDILSLLKKFNELGLDVIKTENLYTFDGKLGFTLAQGQ